MLHFSAPADIPMKVSSLGLASALLLSAPLVYLTSAAAPIGASSALAASATSPAAAEDINWGDFDVDTGHSTLGFKVKHMGVSWTHGRFNTFEGTLHLDQDPSKCTVQIQAESKSVDTASEDRDKHLRSPDFFDAVAHPLIGFESIEVAAAGAGKYKVTGNLSLHGVSKEIEIVMELVGAKDLGQRSGYRAGFIGQAVIDRTEFGMNTYAKEGGIGKEVTLDLSFELMRK